MPGQEWTASWSILRASKQNSMHCRWTTNPLCPALLSFPFYGSSLSAGSLRLLNSLNMTTWQKSAFPYDTWDMVHMYSAGSAGTHLQSEG